MNCDLLWGSYSFSAGQFYSVFFLGAFAFIQFHGIEIERGLPHATTMHFFSFSSHALPGFVAWGGTAWQRGHVGAGGFAGGDTFVHTVGLCRDLRVLGDAFLRG